jgi:hypothetical protein
LKRGVAVGNRFNFEGARSLQPFFFQIRKRIRKECDDPTGEAGKKSCEEFLPIGIEAKNQWNEIGGVKEKCKGGPDEKKDPIE